MESSSCIIAPALAIVLCRPSVATQRGYHVALMEIAQNVTSFIELRNLEYDRRDQTKAVGRLDFFDEVPDKPSQPFFVTV